jgi:ATP-dependent Clp protease ATP-binding subunit ClpA
LVLKKLKEQEVDIKFTEDALRYLVQKGYTPDFGARPLRRVIEQEIEDKLADEILAGRLSSGAKVTVDADIAQGKLKFRIVNPQLAEHN